MSTLRGPQGCPWDKKQTYESIKNYLIEEAYEIIDAVEENNPAKIEEELGDLLFIIIFYSQLGHEENDFNLNSIIQTVNDKMIRRHPHVFDNTTLETPEQVYTQWEQIKAKEQQHENRKTILDGIPKHLPALLQAKKVIKKQQSDHEKIESSNDIWNSFKNKINQLNSNEIEQHFGELLYDLSRMCVQKKINPEETLKTHLKKIAQ